MWDEKKVPFWINEICEKTMHGLLELKYPYKFIVTCMLIQKTEKPLYGCFSMHWENNIDNIE
jgi:dynein light chain Tctex-type 1